MTNDHDVVSQIVIKECLRTTTTLAVTTEYAITFCAWTKHVLYIYMYT